MVINERERETRVHQSKYKRHPTISIRLGSPSEKEIIKDKAQTAGKSVNAFVVDVALGKDGCIGIDKKQIVEDFTSMFQFFQKNKDGIVISPQDREMLGKILARVKQLGSA